MTSAPLQAESLAACLPAILVEADRVAATVAQGLHGRRRVGVGEAFWQFRPFVTGDAVARIDWRRSGRSDQVFVRDAEWEAAQTVAVWYDAGASMDWRSAVSLPYKSERARLLLLALACLVLRGGERVRLLSGADGDAALVTGGVSALGRLNEALTRSAPGLPVALPPAHGRVVLFGDWLGDLAELAAYMGRLAALPARGAVVQVLDPAELELPYTGRVRFVGVGDPRTAIISRVQAVREAYRARLVERQAELARLCRGAGFDMIVHRTDAASYQPLWAVHQGLTGSR